MPSNTTNFNWIKPTVGGDDDVWGDYLDTNLDSQDTLIRNFMNNFISSSAPATAQAGTTWLDNTTNPYVWKMYDGTDWITLGTLNATTNSFVAPAVPSNYVGDMKFSCQGSNHGGWLLCNGQSLSTTTYSGLFALIGYAFGGSGANFLAPDLRGRVPGAIGTGSGLSPRTLGQTVGAETHTLTKAQLPDPITDTSATIFAESGSAVECLYDNTSYGDGTVTNQGGNQPHNNMQPTLFVGNYFIYSGV